MQFPTRLKRFAVAIWAVSSSVSGPAWSGDWIPDFLQSADELFCQKCEEEISKRLKSPSSYVRIECLNARKSEMNKTEYARFRGKSSSRELIKPEITLFELGIKYRFDSIVRYEAANSFGASIAGASLCSTVGKQDQTALESVKSGSDIYIDGETQSMWLRSQILQ